MMRPESARPSCPGNAAPWMAWKAGRQVDREDLRPSDLDRELVDRRDVLDAGVVDQDVDGTEPPRDLIDHRGNFQAAWPCPRRNTTRSTSCSAAIPARSFSICTASPKPLSMTLQPCAANARAMPSPIPLVEPVTMTDLPFNMRDFLGRGWIGTNKSSLADHPPRPSACPTAEVNGPTNRVAPVELMRPGYCNFMPCLSPACPRIARLRRWWRPSARSGEASVRNPAA